jgi:DNA-binding transcriptional ArsR family regulator
MELAKPFHLSLPSVSRHLKVLETTGLVSKSRSAQWRRCRLELAQLRAADDWLAPYREFFDARIDRLEEHLKTMVADRKSRDPIPTTQEETEER